MILRVCWAHEQLDARDGPQSLWFREVHLNRNNFKLGLDNLSGGTPNPFATAQAVRVISGLKTSRGVRVHCELHVLLG